MELLPVLSLYKFDFPISFKILIGLSERNGVCVNNDIQQGGKPNEATSNTDNYQ